MRFRFDEDQRAMRDAVRSFCADRFALADIADRDGKPTDPALWPALAELGVLGVLAGEPASGIGLVEASIAFEELGACLAPGPLLWSVLAAAHVEGAAEGAVRVAGVEIGERASGPVVIEHADECDVLLVLRGETLEVVRRADLPAAQGGTPFDPLTAVAVFPGVPTGRPVGDSAGVRRLRLAGVVLSSALLVGVAQGALDTARRYALEREQFGAPIGSFQAIKHLLADMYVRVELARAATYAAAATAATATSTAATAGTSATSATSAASAASATTDHRYGDAARAAGAAKLLAGEAGLGNGRAAVQILGGMGFTWEMLPHYFLKRAWVLENTFGSTSSHAAHLGSAVGSEV